MTDFENQIKQMFLDEAEELLVEVEKAFLDFENSGEISDCISKIFRLVHTLKGSAKAVGFDDLATLVHSYETLLVVIREKKIIPDKVMLHELLTKVDAISLIIKQYRENPERKLDVSILVKELDSLISQATYDESNASSHSQNKQKNLNLQNEEGIIFDLDALADYVANKNINLPQTSSSEFCEKNCNSEKKYACSADINQTNSKKANSAADETMRVSVERIDRLVNGIGEIVILKSFLIEQRNALPNQFLQRTVSQLDKITNEVRDVAIGLRMMPLKGLFQKMQRIVRDTANQLNKNIVFITEGENTELDRTMIEQLSDPLLHMIRNAVDHGIESNQEREKLNKPLPATVSLKAHHTAGKILIEIFDDGKGVNIDRIVQKAKDKGIISPNANLTKKESFDLMFVNGLSTKDSASDISGRGVGMDVVRTNIESMQGEIEVESTLGVGSSFKIFLPLTLSIIDAMLVDCGSERYLIPVSNIHESFRPEKEDVGCCTEKGEFLNLRGEILPIFRLPNLLRLKNVIKPVWENIAIIVRNNKIRPFCILVDDIVAKQQVVIKSLGEELKGLPGISGGAILGDGKTALILDVNDLILNYK